MKNLSELLQAILSTESRFLEGLHTTPLSYEDTIPAIREWAECFGRDPSSVTAALGACLWQSIIMSMIPEKGISPEYSGSIDLAIEEHCMNIGVELSDASITTIRNICLNIRKQHGLNKNESRRLSASLARLRAQPELYSSIRRRQGGRCLWCGVQFSRIEARETLDHYTPKHIGDDLPTGVNWVLSCETCNAGKADTFAWPANPYAHDYLRREDLQSRLLSKEHRWVVLARDKVCHICKSTTMTTELFVSRRIATGLITPSNCSAVCSPCAMDQNWELPVCEYTKNELGRTAT